MLRDLKNALLIILVFLIPILLIFSDFIFLNKGISRVCTCKEVAHD